MRTRKYDDIAIGYLYMYIISYSITYYVLADASY